VQGMLIGLGDLCGNYLKREIVSMDVLVLLDFSSYFT